MEQTIKVSSSVKQVLDKMKMFERETYNDIIEVLLEDHLELNEKTKKELEERSTSGKFISHEEVIKKFGV
jgi:predicted transcriptional regulator